MTGFQPGEIIDITIKGVSVDSTNTSGSVLIWADAGIWAMPPQAAITRVAPRCPGRSRGVTGREEDHRITLARKILAESKAVDVGSENPGRWWGKLEGALEMLLGVVEEPKR